METAGWLRQYALHPPERRTDRKELNKIFEITIVYLLQLVYSIRERIQHRSEVEKMKPVKEGKVREIYDNGDNPYLDFDSELVQGGRQVHIRYCLQ